MLRLFGGWRHLLGGIGLLLTQAIITQKDWEEVAYYIILIILMVLADIMKW